MKKSAVSLLVSLCSAVACAATLDYTPSGSAPYVWSNAQNWGGSLPGSADSVTIASSLLLANPLILQSGTSASITGGTIGDGILTVESGASLSASGAIGLAAATGLTGIITNSGTMTVGTIDFGKDKAGKGLLGRFDNFGMLTITERLRMGWASTPSVFYNHEGATVDKTGGEGYTFYVGYPGDSTFINEGTFTSHSGDCMWMGMGAGKSEVFLNKRGVMTTGYDYRTGYNANSTTRIFLNGQSRMSGPTWWRMGVKAGSKTYITLSNESAFVVQRRTGYAYDRYPFSIGAASTAVATLTLADAATAEFDTQFRVGSSSGSRGEVFLDGHASLTTLASIYAGNASATGMITLAESSVMTNKSEAFVLGCGTRGNATMTVKDNARFVNPATAYIAHGQTSPTIGATGSLTFEGNSRGEFGHYLHVASSSNSWGALTVKDSASISVARELMIGCAHNATGHLTIADNARLDMVGAGAHPLQIASVWLSVGHAVLTNNSMVVASNITVGAGTGSKGVLEVCEGCVISNVWQLQVGSDSANSTEDGKGGYLKMRGGTILFNIGQGKNNTVIWLNPLLSETAGSISGWGKLAFTNPRTMVTEMDSERQDDYVRPGGITHYGPIVADGGGQMRDLDCGRLGVLNYESTIPNPVGSTNGWYAVNKGRLRLPRCVPRRTAGHRCVGDYWKLTKTSKRLANTFTYAMEGAELGNYMFAELYATDRDDIPAGLDAIGADKTLAVWRIGHFSDGPEIDEPTHPAAFTSASLGFRYCADPDLLDGLVVLRVYRHDGTAAGRWTCVGRAEPSTDNPVISAAVAAPSAANWNMGWFAITGRTKPFGSTLSIR